MFMILKDRKRNKNEYIPAPDRTIVLTVHAFSSTRGSLRRAQARARTTKAARREHRLTLLLLSRQQKYSQTCRKRTQTTAKPSQDEKPRKELVSKVRTISTRTTYEEKCRRKHRSYNRLSRCRNDTRNYSRGGEQACFRQHHSKQREDVLSRTPLLHLPQQVRERLPFLPPKEEKQKRSRPHIASLALRDIYR